jgi:hypothetical protein
MSLLHTHEILISIGSGVINEVNLIGKTNQTGYVQTEQAHTTTPNRIEQGECREIL